MNLRVVGFDEIENMDPSWFPMAFEYLGHGGSTYGDTYKSDKFIWMLAVQDGENPPPVGVVCITADRVLPKSCHVSVLEVRSDVRSRGYGKNIMAAVESMCGDLSLLSLTLQTRDLSLVPYYQKLGFKSTHDHEGLRYMRKYLTKSP